jgi:hypothetical protein
MNKSRFLHTTLTVITLLFLATASTFASSDAPGVDVVVGSGQAHITFENAALAGMINAEQVKLLAARVGAQEGDFFFIVTETVPGNVFSCGSCSSTRGSVSINLPPNSTVLRVSAARGNGKSSLLVNGVSNESSSWMSFTSADFSSYVAHKAPRGMASSK